MIRDQASCAWCDGVHVTACRGSLCQGMRDRLVLMRLRLSWPCVPHRRHGRHAHRGSNVCGRVRVPCPGVRATLWCGSAPAMVRNKIGRAQMLTVIHQAHVPHECSQARRNTWLRGRRWPCPRAAACMSMRQMDAESAPSNSACAAMSVAFTGSRRKRALSCSSVDVRYGCTGARVCCRTLACATRALPLSSRRLRIASARSLPRPFCLSVIDSPSACTTDAVTWTQHSSRVLGACLAAAAVTRLTGNSRLELA